MPNWTSLQSIDTSEQIHLRNFSQLPDAGIEIFSSSGLPLELKEFGWVIFDTQRNVAQLSDNIPEWYRRYVMRHETCCLSGSAPNSWHCRLASEHELSLVPVEQKTEYITWRISFLENLIIYMQNNPNERNNRFSQEIKGSVEYLKLEKSRKEMPTWDLLVDNFL